MKRNEKNPKYPTKNPNLGATHQRLNTQNPPHSPKTLKDSNFRDRFKRTRSRKKN
jgi:hypothetical protein